MTLGQRPARAPGASTCRERAASASASRTCASFPPLSSTARVRVARALGASFSPHVARVHPAKLVRGLAGVGSSRWGSRSTSRRRCARSALTRRSRRRERCGPAGSCAPARATRPGSPACGELLVPMNSSMIVTEPLPAAAWEEIGWAGRELLSDGAHVYVYLQRTADGRIAIGGRGRALPLRLAHRRARRRRRRDTVAHLRAQLVEMFPALREVAIDHAWSGVLGVPRDWCLSIDADPATGLAWAGGYVGEGVAASNLAGRTLRDLILGEPTPLTALAWVGRAPRRWEPEPLRWASIRAVYALYRRADARRAARRAALAPGPCRRPRRGPLRGARAGARARSRAPLGGSIVSEPADPRSEMAFETLLYDTAGAAGHDHAEPARSAQHDRPADARRARGGCQPGGRRPRGQGHRAARRRPRVLRRVRLRRRLSPLGRAAHDATAPGTPARTSRRRPRRASGRCRSS